MPDTRLLYERWEVPVLQHHRGAGLPVSWSSTQFQSLTIFILYIQLSARLPRPEVREEVCQLRPGRAPDERQVSNVSPGYRPLPMPLVTVGLVIAMPLF